VLLQATCNHVLHAAIRRGVPAALAGRGGMAAMYELSLVIALVAFVAVVVAYARMEACNVYHPFLYYCLFHGFIFVFRPIVAYFSGFELIYIVYQFQPSYQDKVTVILAATLGFLSFAFFCLRSGAGGVVIRRDAALEVERTLLAKVLVWAVVLPAPLALYSLLSRYQEKAEGYTTMVMDRATGVFMNTATSGYITDAQAMLPALCAMVAWMFRFRLLALVPMAAFVLIRAGTGGRGFFVTACISLALLWLYQQRRQMFSPRVLVAMAALVLVFDQVGEDRGAAIRAFIAGEQVEQGSGGEAKWLEGMDFGNMEYFEFLVYAVPQRSGEYGYFLNNLQLFTEPVPRVLWPGKPAGAPFSNIALFDYGYPIGMTRSLPGEGWYSLGWIGVIVWCGLWGGLLGWLYRRWADSDQGTLKTLAYLLFLPSLVVAYRDGTLLTIARQNLWFLAPVILAALLARWFAVPRLPEIRRYLNARRQGAGAAGPAGPGPRPSPKPRGLPPAVERRRAALAALRGDG